MLSFQDFYNIRMMCEASGKACVFAFGRFNPPTKGHLKLMDIMVQEARKHSCPALLFLSHSQDSNKNPLPYKEKLDFVRKAAPSGLTVVESPAKNVFDCLANLGATGYKVVWFIAGDDRGTEYQKFEKYKKDFGIDEIHIVSAGKRGQGSLDNVENISATELRKMAKDGNEIDFTGLCALYSKPAEATKLYKATRKGLGL